MEKIVAIIRETPVELFKILKFENIAQSGGEAKYMIADGMVKVNGKQETRKRKKIVPGDKIEVGNILIEVQLKAE